MVDDFELFSEQARYVVAFAQDEGQRRGADRLLTEHLLAGFMNYIHGSGLLAALKIPVPQGGTRVPEFRRFIGPPAPLELSPAVQSVITFAREEMNDPDLRSDAVGLEHLLVGLLREEQGTAGRTLREHGLTPERVRMHIVRAEITAAEKIASGAELRIWGTREDLERLRALSQQKKQPMDDLVWEAVQRTWFAPERAKDKDE